MFRNDEKHLKKMALGTFCLLLLWVALPGHRIEQAATPTTTAPAESTKSVANKVHKTLYTAVPGKARRTLRELIQGRAVADMWSHRIWVSPCHWSQRKTLRANTEEDSHQVFKCSGVKVEIVNEELRVNEKSYGKLSKGVEVGVVNGRVFIGDKEVQPITQVAQK
jgi:hypothetical protein